MFPFLNGGNFRVSRVACFSVKRPTNFAKKKLPTQLKKLTINARFQQPQSLPVVSVGMY
jgi:hypothetical protein